MIAHDNALSVSQPAISRILQIPFVNTLFSVDLKCYFMLWPVWWLLGIEQLLPLFFLGWMTLRSLIRAGGKVQVNYTILFALALAGWWFVPIFWVDPEQFDVAMAND